jgi:glutathione peroxidase-family protein
MLNKEGKVVERFSPTTKPEEIEKYLVRIL